MDEYTNCETDLRLNGKVAIVTGATSGMGLEVAKNLAKRGAKVIVAGRNPTRLQAAKNEIIRHSGHGDVEARQMDFESLTSVRKFVDITYKTEPKVDILINNIGGIGLADKLTNDGLQTMMQVNYFGTFLLTYLLFPLLRRSAPSRIVNVSSIGMLLGDINFDKWNEAGAYSSVGYYCNAKLAQVAFTVEMNRRIKNSGVNIYSIDPGVVKSDFFRNLDNEGLKRLLNTGLSIIGNPPYRAARMHVFAAIDPRLEEFSGQHFRGCQQFYSHWLANDTEFGARFWTESKRLVKIKNYEDWEI